MGQWSETWKLRRVRWQHPKKCHSNDNQSTRLMFGSVSGSLNHLVMLVNWIHWQFILLCAWLCYVLSGCIGCCCLNKFMCRMLLNNFMCPIHVTISAVMNDDVHINCLVSPTSFSRFSSFRSMQLQSVRSPDHLPSLETVLMLRLRAVPLWWGNTRN